MGMPVALPPPAAVPLLHCSWGQWLLLPRELGHCRGASAASHEGVGLGPGPGLWAQRGRLGLRWCSGRVHLVQLCPGLALKSLGLCEEMILV